MRVSADDHPQSPTCRSVAESFLGRLAGDRKGTWAVSVSGNWRVTFKFVENDADAVDYEDYH